MINAHIEQSSVYWAQHEKRLYNFRILELSEPFREGRNSDTALSRSCDNVTQRLKQFERHKRISEPCASHITQMRAPNRRFKMCNRTQSLPLDLSDWAHDFSPDDFRKDYLLGNKKGKHIPASPVRRKMNGFNKDSFENDDLHPGVTNKLTKSCHDLKNSKDDTDFALGSHTASHTSKSNNAGSSKENFVIDDVLTDVHCRQIKSNLHDLSTRYDEKQLQTKSREELVSIILELQDALRLATDE